MGKRTQNRGHDRQDRYVSTRSEPASFMLRSLTFSLSPLHSFLPVLPDTTVYIRRIHSTKVRRSALGCPGIAARARMAVSPHRQVTSPFYRFLLPPAPFCDPCTGDVPPTEPELPSLPFVVRPTRRLCGARLLESELQAERSDTQCICDPPPLAVTRRQLAQACMRT